MVSIPLMAAIAHSVGSNIIMMNNMTRKSKEQEVYTDFEHIDAFLQGPYQESKRSKITRVNRVYNLFNALSTIEQDNFINLIKNRMIE